MFNPLLRTPLSIVQPEKLRETLVVQKLHIFYENQKFLHCYQVSPFLSSMRTVTILSVSFSLFWNYTRCGRFLKWSCDENFVGIFHICYKWQRSSLFCLLHAPVPSFLPVKSQHSKLNSQNHSWYLSSVLPILFFITLKILISWALSIICTLKL